MTKMLVLTLHLKLDAKLTTVNEITRNLFVKQVESDVRIFFARMFR